MRDFQQARELYDKALAGKDLREVCGDDEACVIMSALQLRQIEQSLGNEQAAANWLRLAEETAGPVVADEPPSLLGVALLTAQARHVEAIRSLRGGVFAWQYDDGGYDLEFPIYFVDGNALLDPLRDEPEFQRLLDDYLAYLEPMRQRVLEVERSGNWEAIRQRTFERARGESN